MNRDFLVEVTMEIKLNKTSLTCFKDGRCIISNEHTQWSSCERARIVFDSSHIVYFDEMISEQSVYQSGTGKGIKTTYEINQIKFETRVFIEAVSEEIYFELIPLCFEADFEAIYWPSSFEFDQCDENWITLLPHMQGLMIPNNYENECRRLNFDGQFCSNGAYMPWMGQIKEGNGYIMISLTPWDMAYQVDHPAYGPYTHVRMRHLSSMGKLSYRRIIKMVMQEDADIVSLCKIYRQYALEKGKLVTLKEKAIKNKNVDKLIGCAFLHKGIKTHITKDSEFYDPYHPEKNDHVTTFEKRAEEIEYFHSKGIDKLYLHLDGWGEYGYDNAHPDILPACKSAGGWDSMKKLSDTLEKYGYMFGLHDQYRDYYVSAASFDESSALMQKDGKIFNQCRWAGGAQSYLCASQAPYYVKRNIEEILRHGIHLEASYLDVFTCNELDECYHEHHPMSRKECMEYRESCFWYLHSKNILPSSEEVNDWAIRSLVFAHYGPYDFMLRNEDTARLGIPVPLWNLVYHDCVILPWPMDHSGKEDYMLYALLNGGGAYIDKEGAYPNIDGVFDDKKKDLDEEIERWKIVSNLQEKVAKCEMTDFGFLENDYLKQYSVFDDQIRVEINLHDNTFQIIYK